MQGPWSSEKISFKLIFSLVGLREPRLHICNCLPYRVLLGASYLYVFTPIFTWLPYTSVALNLSENEGGSEKSWPPRKLAIARHYAGPGLQMLSSSTLPDLFHWWTIILFCQYDYWEINWFFFYSTANFRWRWVGGLSARPLTSLSADFKSDE